jgi:hypothetical protein
MKALFALLTAAVSALLAMFPPALSNDDAASSIGAPDTAAYIQVQNIIGSAADPSRTEGSGSCLIYPGRGPCSGVIYVRGDESGQSVGSIINDRDSVQFEILYSLAMDYENSAPSLIGSIYAFQLDRSGVITGGKKLMIHDTLLYGESRTLTFEPPRSPKPITMTFQVVREASSVQVAYGSGTLTLVSTQMIDGKPWSTNGNTVPLVVKASSEAPTHFVTRFNSRPSGGKFVTMNYAVDVSFTPPLHREKMPARCELEFSRMYWVTDTSSAKAHENAQWATGTTYKKQVEIVPGKVIKLIFPADEPSVAGFHIEDTLIIVP